MANSNFGKHISRYVVALTVASRWKFIPHKLTLFLPWYAVCFAKTFFVVIVQFIFTPRNLSLYRCKKLLTLLCQYVIIFLYLWVQNIKREEELTWNKDCRGMWPAYLRQYFSQEDWLWQRAETIDVIYDNINVYKDNVICELKDSNGSVLGPFIYNGLATAQLISKFPRAGNAVLRLSFFLCLF